MPASTAGANTPGRVRDALAPFRRDGTLPDYPLGSDFTEVEQRLVRALGWLKASTGTPLAKAATVLASLRDKRPLDDEALARMRLDRPKGLGEKVMARLVSHALNRTR